MKNNICSITFQDYGSSILIFLTGQTPKDAYDKWLSLANWGGTSLLNGAEPKFCADCTISCWSTIESLSRYLFNLEVMKLWDTQAEAYKGKKNGFLAEALKRAETVFDGIATESFRSVNNNFEPYEFGVIMAEKEDDNFIEQCYKKAFAN